MKLLYKFLKDSENQFSSKRLGFIGSIIIATVASAACISFFLFKGKYSLAVELVNSIWLASLGFAGAVASEHLLKKKK